DSRIYKVEFYDSWHKIGEAFEPPYKINWSCPATRDFTITAKAWDELGAMGKSAIVKRDAVITSISQPVKNNYQLTVYPNPASKEFNFQYQHIENKSIELSIYNTQGMLIKKLEWLPGAASSALLTWNPEKHHAGEGLYLYHSVISCGKETVEEKGKIVYSKN
ncbi:MAG TPA: T9SS type A sorting domain-containing protein, partial [Prolixibacteraceae bacterium]|nr:T9SS type A sorting domain-containing protein [Prolixibacteraceae bacterium]